MQDFSAARRAMVDSQLRPEAVIDRGVLAAMGRIARERFIPEPARALAYSDRPVPLDGGRAMMPPAALGRLLSELAPRPGERALIVGSATGYSAALLREIGLDVVALESDSRFSAAARELGVETVTGSLQEGWPKGAPFDLILIDGAVEEIPAALVRQLAPAGRLGAALVERGIARLVVGQAASGSFGIRSVVDVDVALLPGFEKPRVFTF
jgi:protein-L-isoaspartate(D-aspartate) O-methyltransferase